MALYLIKTLREVLQRCGVFRGIEGYEVEYRVCLPEGVTPQDVESAR
jgi:hypothetical protein